MATRRKKTAPRPRSTVAGWVRKLPFDTRQVRLASLNTSIKLLRRYYSGFDARDGFSLNDLKALPKNRADKVLKMAHTLRQIQSRPFINVRPRKAKSKQVLRMHTGQRQPKQKVFAVHSTLGVTEQTKIKIRGKKLEFNTPYIDKEGKAHTRTVRNYYFAFAKRIRTWDDIMTEANKMIARLPPGRYSIISSIFEMVGATVDRENLMRKFQEWFDQYHTMTDKEGMAETLIGVRWIGKDSQQSAPYRSLAQQQTDEFMAKQRAKRERERRAIVRRKKHK